MLREPVTVAEILRLFIASLAADSKRQLRRFLDLQINLLVHLLVPRKTARTTIEQNQSLILIILCLLGTKYPFNSIQASPRTRITAGFFMGLVSNSVQADLMVSGQRCCLLIRPGEKIEPEFLTYHLSTPSNQSWIVRQAVGATMPNINTSILSKVPLNVPNKKAQQKIAVVLSTLDAKIDCNNRINTELEAMAKTCDRHLRSQSVDSNQKQQQRIYVSFAL